MKHVEIGEHTYSIPRLTPWDAFHVTRRLGPLLVGIGPQILGLVAIENETDKALGIMQSLFGDSGMRFTQILAMMPDTEIDYVANLCLRNVTMKQGSKAWAKILTEGAERPTPMFPHIKSSLLLRLIIEVLKEELTDFLAVSNYSGAAPPTTP